MSPTRFDGNSTAEEQGFAVEGGGGVKPDPLAGTGEGVMQGTQCFRCTCFWGDMQGIRSPQPCKTTWVVMHTCSVHAVAQWTCACRGGEAGGGGGQGVRTQGPGPAAPAVGHRCVQRKPSPMVCAWQPAGRSYRPPARPKGCL